eukprot:TRINITY_DN1634_c0_g1_i3.p1 TRINITY_DN1634_c0_g1~~TRINITY_DN1634_c0_g1_i3.p1  ORF type:complete len:153 (-),score=25.42 TRINITY_DN1634_c0_g1_i3:6-464(-)
MQCTEPCDNDIWSGDTIDMPAIDSMFKAEGDLPKCRNCGELARPNVLMFGDWDFIPDRTEEQHQRYSEFLHNIQGKRVVIVEIGAGYDVPTVRSQSENLTRELQDAFLIRINPRDVNVPFDISKKSEVLQTTGLFALEDIDKYLFNKNLNLT